MRHLRTQSIFIALLLAFVALVFDAWVSNANTRTLIDNNRKVAHTQEVLAALQSTLAALVDAETGERGYLITGDERFLESYDRARATLDPTIARLAQLSADNAAQHERIARLRPLAASKLHELQQLIDLRRRQGFAAAQAVVATGQSKRSMDELRALIATVAQEEHAQLALRSAQSEASAARTVGSFALVFAVASALLGVIAVLIWRQTRERAASEAALRASIDDLRQTEHEVRSLNAMLEQRVAERTAQLETANKELEAFSITLEQRVAERTAQLETANKELEAFSYTVSHDLRAPLRGMQGFAQILLEDYADRLGNEGRSCAQHIIGAAQDMNQLVEDLLAYSRLSHATLPRQAVGLQQVVADVLRQAQPAIDAAGATIEVAPDLPVVVGHRATLVQALINLLMNAIKFTKRGVAPQVRIGVEQRRGQVRLCVEDEGIGIDPAHHERIFRVFERLHGIERYPGTGIGLAIVRKGAERMGGAAGVESQPGRGSRFWIELPKEAA